MGELEQILEAFPKAPGWQTDWEGLWKTSLAPFFEAMAKTPQTPRWHGEGDVFTHTRMVCEQLQGMGAFQTLPQRERDILFLAALLHDVGKPDTTKREGEDWVSPYHGSVGSRLVREFLWLTCGLCGSAEAFSFRETVCSLIRSHSTPENFLDAKNPASRIARLSQLGDMCGDYHLSLLWCLSRCDVLGRIAEDVAERVEGVDLWKEMAEEMGCLDTPLAFANPYTKRAYFKGGAVQPGTTLYDDTWGEVLMLSGLPGTGKDTWLQTYRPELPMVSLDEVRRREKISPVGPQGEVVRIAREEAKEYLRKKQAFCFNATNVVEELRREWISLFESYGARVRILYLETDWETEQERNKGRQVVVPEAAILRMLKRLQVPTPDEAQIVEWVFV